MLRRLSPISSPLAPNSSNSNRLQQKPKKFTKFIAETDPDWDDKTEAERDRQELRRAAAAVAATGSAEKPTATSNLGSTAPAAGPASTTTAKTSRTTPTKSATTTSTSSAPSSPIDLASHSTSSAPADAASSSATEERQGGGLSATTSHQPSTSSLPGDQPDQNPDHENPDTNAETMDTAVASPPSTAGGAGGSEQAHHPPYQHPHTAPGPAKGGVAKEVVGTITGILRRSSELRREETPKKVDPETKMIGDLAKLNSMSIRYTKFKNLLEQPNIDLEHLRKLSWSGIPEEIRPTVWKLLMGYLPTNSDRREATLTRKRKEYEDYVAQSFARGQTGMDQQLHHQIHIDIQRTNANIPLYQHPTIQESLERILYIWAIRHPASGYVQGINDLVTPFFQVFLQAHVSDDVEKTDVTKIPKEILTQVESDSFFCLTKLLDGIQDNYTFAQPGIQRQVARLKELINRLD
ncbi:GTPase-activating protein, partial [Quaeritorhiza haematococci]